MSRLWTVSLLVSGFVACAAPASANDYLFGSMFTTPQVRHYRPIFAAAPAPVAAPVACCAAPAPTCCPAPQPIYSAAPQPVTYARPVIYGPPVAAARVPVATYRPVVAAPVTTYRPVGQPMAVTTYPAPVARAPVARTKFYWPWQPVRNVGRAVLPGTPTPVAQPY